MRAGSKGKETFSFTDSYWKWSTIVSGIAKYYKPEEMVGKKVAVITNLKPCKLCGVESQGMILAAADDDGNLSVMTLDKDMPAGSEIC